MTGVMVNRCPEGETALPAFDYFNATDDELVWLTLCGDEEAFKRLGYSMMRYNPYHAKDGKFTTGGAGGNAAQGTSQNISADQADRLADDVKNQGGFTYDVSHGVYEEYGYSVSPYPNRSEEIPMSDFGGHSIEQYVDNNADLLSRQDHMLGGWHDKENNSVWLDTTIVVFEKDKAVAMGHVFNQKAIFDLQKGVEIPTGGTGRSIRSLTPSRVERDVSHGGRACAECAANSNPKNVPVHPGCQCSIETKEIGLGVSPEELAGLLETHAASTLAGVRLEDFPEAVMPDASTGAVFSMDDFRFGDLMAWSELVGRTADFTVLLRDEASVGLFKALAGVGLSLYIAYDERDHDGAIIVGPDAGVEGLAQAYGLLMEGDQ